MKDESTRIVAPRPESMKPPDAFTSSWSHPPPPDADDPLLGQVLQRTYEVKRIIGEGGMGRVYEARHTRITKKRYALKVLHPEFAREPEVRTRFKREAEAAASIAHPNVVGVYDVALTEQGWPFLVCEYLEGIDFSELIKEQGPLAPVLAVNIVLQVCDALIAAHQRGVIHRDLKPQNVFLVGDPQNPLAKVLDFGLSRFTDGSDNSLTKTGMIMGTPSYMSPEQARGERTDQLTDVYGVGAILYAAVTGQPPFNEETPQATLLAAMNFDAPRPHTVNPLVSVYLEMVIQKAMAKDPKDRYPSMQALRDAIGNLDLGEAGASTMLTPVSSEVMQDEASTARGQLVFYTLTGAIALGASLTAAITGGVYLTVGRWPFSKTEVLLSVLVVAGTLLTPAILLLRKVRRSVWGSTHRVVELLRQVRAPVIAGLIAYGASALTLRFVDGALLGSPARLGWPGWSVVLLVVALLVAFFTWVRKRWEEAAATRLRRLLFGPGLYVLATLLSVAVLYAGLLWRDAQPVWSEIMASRAAATFANIPEQAEASPAGRPETPGESPQPELQEARAPDANEQAEEAPPARADSKQLQAAVSEGLPGLQQLSKKYPEDPRVLRALVMEHGSRAPGLSQAMATMKRLFAVDPKAVEDEDLQIMIRRTSAKSPPASILAYQLMGEHMGTVGTDMLYNLWLDRPHERTKIMQRLSKPEVRDQLSPALAIAIDLRKAKTCKARLPLLERAAEHGDRRSIVVLSGLISGTKRGCGYKQRKPCKPVCRKYADKFQKAMETISRRSPG